VPHAGIVSKQLHVGSRKQHVIVQGVDSSFLTPKFVGGRHPFTLKFALKVTHLPFNSTISTNICS